MRRGFRRPERKGLRTHKTERDRRFRSAPPPPRPENDPKPWWIPPRGPRTKPWTDARLDWLLSRRGRVAWKRVIRSTGHRTSVDRGDFRHWAILPYWRDFPSGWSYGHHRQPWWTSFARLPHGWPTVRRRERVWPEPVWDGTIW